MVKAPIVVVANDDGSISFYDSPTDVRIAQDVEPIDLRNGEYSFYDSEGRQLDYQVVSKSQPLLWGIFRSEIEQVEFKTAESEPHRQAELRKALVRFLSAKGISQEPLGDETLSVLIQKAFDSI